MIDDFNHDRTGWARFSDDRTMRYRLARSLIGAELRVEGGLVDLKLTATTRPAKRCVFLMLNPSTADAFVLDPTIKRCVSFARDCFGAELLEVVNIFALRSTDPKALKKYAHGSRGDDADNWASILGACAGAHTVVAGWGKHGALDHRGVHVRHELFCAGVKLHHLGLNKTDGSPKHPLYLKGETPLEVWT